MADAMATAAPTDDTTDPTAGTSDAGADTGDDSASGPTVLLTVMDNHDGTFTLTEGDEDDDSESSEAGDGSEEGGADTSSTGGDEAEPEGQTYDSPGALLKGILEIIQKAEQASSGEGSPADNFDAGFAGDGAARPAKPSMQKY